jgi:hypothetical protein
MTASARRLDRNWHASIGIPTRCPLSPEHPATCPSHKGPFGPVPYPFGDTRRFRRFHRGAWEHGWLQGQALLRGQADHVRLPPARAQTECTRAIRSTSAKNSRGQVPAPHRSEPAPTQGFTAKPSSHSHSRGTSPPPEEPTSPHLCLNTFATPPGWWSRPPVIDIWHLACRRSPSVSEVSGSGAGRSVSEDPGSGTGPPGEDGGHRRCKCVNPISPRETRTCSGRISLADKAGRGRSDAARGALEHKIKEGRRGPAHDLRWPPKTGARRVARSRARRFLRCTRGGARRDAIPTR